MGCKINKKHPLVEDSVKDIKKSETLDLSKLNPPPAIPIEKDIRFKASELIGEKKGNILDHYIFETDLGSGAFGKVKKAKHRVTGLVRAVKIIKKAGLSLEEVNKLKNEIEILKNLDHPHILKVYEYYQDKNDFYIISELCSGGELFERIVKAGSFSEKKASKVLNQILQAIKYVHNHKIIHRDLKPENILYESDDEDSPLKIIDFGTSVIYNPNKKMEENVGTCYYVAPEVLKGKYDYKCDLWSCGVMLYILLSGYPPFRGDSEDEIIESVKLGKYNLEEPEFETVSEDAKSLIKRLLTYDPTKRIDAEQALSDNWLKRYEDLPDKPLINKALTNMRTFRADRKIQVAVWTFLTSFLTINEEKKDLLNIFKALDVNKDGQLTKEELLDSYMQTMDKAKAQEYVTQIMESCDTDKSGKIDYNEFLMSTLNREKMLSKEKLDQAFKLFDEDGNGYISSNELKAVFCGDNKIPLKLWDAMVKDIDENGDGKVSHEEFNKMMHKLLNSEIQN